MKFLDWIEAKINPLEAIKKRPSMRRPIFAAEMEDVGKQIANLRVVGRGEDADRIMYEFLNKFAKEWSDQPEDPNPLRFLVTAAVKFDCLKFAKDALKLAIEASKDNERIDKTLIYFDLGRIYHQLRGDPEKELWCYYMATTAPTAPNCKFPASREQKAVAHHFGFMCARRLGYQERYEWHNQQRKELAPDVNWDSLSESASVIQHSFGLSREVK